MRAQMRANARARKWRKWKKKCVFDTDTKVSLPLSLSLPLSFSLSFPPIFLVFLFFCDEENKRRERIRKKRVFSRFEFLRTIYEVCACIRALFSTSLSRAVPSQRARVEGTGKWWRVKLSCKVGFCLGSQILNFHSRAFLKLFFFNKIFSTIPRFVSTSRITRKLVKADRVDFCCQTTSS